MTDTTEEEINSEVQIHRTVLLDIPPRLQWGNDHGYCGETAIQAFGLYYGVWISQKLVRDINNGEYLLQKLLSDDRRNPTHTLSVLHFTYDEWDWKNSPQPQFYDYCSWLKRSIRRGHPAMFLAYLLYMDAQDYDHIMPAIGVQFKDENQYEPEDVLIYYNLFHQKQIQRKMSKNDLAATRKTCRKHCNEGGCIPFDIDYGIAVTGILDEDHVTLPVRLSVSAWNEPNTHPAYNENPTEMDGIVTQNDTIYIYTDPKKIPSTESVYYRCVPKPEK